MSSFQTLGFRQLAVVAAAIGLVGAPMVGAAEKTIYPRDEKDLALVVPTNSPARFDSFRKYDVASFRGDFTISGRYEYGYEGEVRGPESAPELAFYPDENLRAQLPYWKRSGPVKTLAFENPNRFIESVIPAEDLKKLRASEINSISGKVTIFAKQYRAWIECDSSHYSVEFVSMKRSTTLLAGNAFVDAGGC